MPPSNNVNAHDDNLKDFLIETRIADGNACIYCEGSYVVKNGKCKDCTQYLYFLLDKESQRNSRRMFCLGCHCIFLAS